MSERVPVRAFKSPADKTLPPLPWSVANDTAIESYGSTADA
jgi:hypothetical protein